MESLGREIWNFPAGGVAELMRDGHTVEAAKLPKKREHTPLAWDLWLSATFLHVRVAVHAGITAMYVLCVYGVPSDPELNTRIWDSGLHYAARLGTAPFLVGGHFHFPLGDLQAAPPWVLGHLVTQWMVDVGASFAAPSGRPLQWSYHIQGAHPGTHIVGVLADPRVAAMVTDVGAIPGRGIPGRLPMVFTVVARYALVWWRCQRGSSSCSWKWRSGQRRPCSPNGTGY